MGNADIHPTAQIGVRVELGEGVVIGPYAIIEDDVCIGEGTVVGAHSVIQSYVKMGPHNQVHSHAVLGGPPQDIGCDPSRATCLEIGEGNVFRENVTISRATKLNRATMIGSNCYFMCNSHVGHDVVVGDGVILGPSVGIGGHCEVGDRVFFGGGAMVHQHCRIGSLAMIAGVIGVRKDVLPYMLVGGEPVRHYRLNLVGLRRAGVTGARLKSLTQAMRALREKEDLNELDDTQEMQYLHNWMAVKSKRGVYGFVEAQSVSEIESD